MLPKAACEYTISPDRYGITGYIYLSNAPKKSSSSSKQNSAQTVIETKSNNANLKTIELSEGKIEFNKDTLEYTINVKNEVNKITS